MSSFKKALIILILYMLPGCAIIKNLPDNNTEFRIHPLGMPVYNQTGSPFSESQWNFNFFIIEGAYEEFKACAGIINKDTEERLLKTPIIIIPAEKIDLPGEEAIAFIDLYNMFIRKDFFDAPTLRHEWTHVYLYLSGKYILGDLYHKDPFFKKCYAHN